MTLHSQLKEALRTAMKGGKGSGNFGHSGRPGMVGGSSRGGNPQVSFLTGEPQIGRAQEDRKLKTADEGRRMIEDKVGPMQERIEAIDKEERAITASVKQYGLYTPEKDAAFRKKRVLKKEREKLVKARDAAVKEIMESFGEENPASLNAHLTTAEEAWGADVIANYVKSHPDAKPDIWDKWAGNSMENNTASWIQEALQEAGTYINGDLVPNNVVNIGNDIRGRAFFHDETNTLFITDTYYSKIVKGSTYHELGHWLEKNIPGAHQAMVDFLDRRTKGEKAKPISVTTRSPKEMFKKDKFFHPYVGKIYQSGDTEVLSMGLEALFKDPYRLAHNDPDMFNTVLSTLKGIPKE